jgi:hypothetical protein
VTLNEAVLPVRTLASLSEASLPPWSCAVKE